MQDLFDDFLEACHQILLACVKVLIRTLDKFIVINAADQLIQGCLLCHIGNRPLSRGGMPLG